MSNNSLRLLSLVIVAILIAFLVFEVNSKTYSNDTNMKTIREIKLYNDLNETKIVSLASSSILVKIWSWLGLNVSYDGFYTESVLSSNGYYTYWKLKSINVVFAIYDHKKFVAYVTIKEDPSATKIIGFSIQRAAIRFGSALK